MFTHRSLAHATGHRKATSQRLRRQRRMGRMRDALRGDCHSHTDWSDGGDSLPEMVRAAAEAGHDYLVITDHSPRLAVAHGLSATRLRQQLEVIAAVNESLAG